MSFMVRCYIGAVWVQLIVAVVAVDDQVVWAS